jgi:hypothetical protein
MGNFLQFGATESRSGNNADHSSSCDEYANYSTEELQGAIRQMVPTLDCTVRVVGDIRDQLLPLLEQLKLRLPHGSWQSFLREIGIRPCTLRKWRQRARLDGQRMREILFDEPVPRHLRIPAAVEHEPDALLAKAATRLAKAVLSGDSCFATQLAQDILESAEL